MSEFRQNLKHGLLWTALDKYSGQIIAIGISMVLARLLTPYDYGVVATASVIINFLSIFTSIGIGPAVIQKKDLSNEDINHIFTFTVIVGLVCGCICFGSSWLVAEYYKNPIIVPVLQILAIGVVLSAINMVPAALMSKHLRFKEMATRSLAFQIFFGLLGIAAAFYGAGVYALIVPPIFASICTFLYNSHFYPVKFRLHFSLTPIKKIFSFSSYLFLFELFNYFSRNIDKIIIGRYISENALGYYEKSYRLMQLPLQNITAVIYPVLQPVLSNLQDNPKEIGVKFASIISMISLVGFPLSVILFFCAPEIITVMFGIQWTPAIPAFKILAISVPFILINNPTGPVFLACNASKRLFYTGVINTCITISGFVIASSIDRTIEMIAWGWTITSIINVLNSYTQLYGRIIKISPVCVFRHFIHPLVCAALLIAAYIGYGYIDVKIPVFLNLCLKGFLGLILGLTFYNLIGDINLREMTRALWNKFRHKHVN